MTIQRMEHSASWTASWGSRQSRSSRRARESRAASVPVTVSPLFFGTTMRVRASRAPVPAVWAVGLEGYAGRCCVVVFENDVDDVNRYWYFYAEATDGANWPGEFPTFIKRAASDHCDAPADTSMQSVGFRELDVGDADNYTLTFSARRRHLLSEGHAVFHRWLSPFRYASFSSFLRPLP